MKISTLYLILVGFLMVGCATNKKIPGPAALPVSVKGMYCRIERDKRDIASGEIIVVESERIFLLDISDSTDNKGIVKIDKAELDSIYIYVASTTNNAAPIVGWAIVLPLLSISHGGFALFSFPVNLIISSVIISSVTGNYYGFHYPEDIAWEDLNKFARFPQGWPEGVSSGDIK